MAEVYEVATFYAHFDVVGDGEERPPPVTVRVCDSLSCTLAGAGAVAAARCRGRSLPGVRVVRAPCIGSCHTAPAAEVGHRHVDPCDAGQGQGPRARGDVHAEMPAYQDFDAYVKAGGYAVLRSCLSGARKVEDVIAALSDGGLRGLGGAGFPTGRKWSLVRAEKAPRLMAVNGDEGEPGTFKDRIYLEKEPHKFPRGHADRGVGGGGRAGLHLHARRVSGGAEDPKTRSPSSRPRASPSTPRCTSAAAPAPTSAAKKAR